MSMALRLSLLVRWSHAVILARVAVLSVVLCSGHVGRDPADVLSTCFCDWPRFHCSFPHLRCLLPGFAKPPQYLTFSTSEPGEVEAGYRLTHCVAEPSAVSHVRTTLNQSAARPRNEGPSIASESVAWCLSHTLLTGPSAYVAPDAGAC